MGDCASEQAATRVNAEQASKRSMCRPTRPPYAIARVKGLDRLEADVLSRNRPMLNVFRRCGLPMAVRNEGDVIHVILSLREAG